jgi:hypothetical protein
MFCRTTVQATCIEDLLKMIQFRVNSFTLASPSLSPIGVAMSPLIALYNHSCQPNAVVVFPEGRREMVVVAISDIQPGEEVRFGHICEFEPMRVGLDELYRRLPSPPRTTSGSEQAIRISVRLRALSKRGGTGVGRSEVVYPTSWV